MRAFIVCGPQSAGNRFVAGVLLAAGCTGDNTPNPNCDGIGKDDFVLIRHDNIPYWAEFLRSKGYDQIFGILCVRDAYANTKSICENRERFVEKTCADAYQHRNETLQQNVLDLTQHANWIDFLSVESLTVSSIPFWLKTLNITIDHSITVIPYWDHDLGCSMEPVRDMRSNNLKYFD